MKLHFRTMSIICAALILVFTSCGRNDEESAGPSGGQTGTPEGEVKPLPWDGKYPDLADAKELLQKALTREGDGTDYKNYVVSISSAEHLAAMNVLVNSRETIDSPEGVTLECNRLRYRLTEDIDLDNKPWTSIGNYDDYDYYTVFKGDFDGQGHVIKNFRVYIDEGTTVKWLYAGVFGYLMPSPDDSSWGIRHLIVEGAISVVGKKYCYAGGICAMSEGNIEFCRFNGSIYAELTEDGNTVCDIFVGGISGIIRESAVVAGCISNVSVDWKIKNPSNLQLSAARGQLVGITAREKNVIVSYSTWNSNTELNREIGKMVDSQKVTLEHTNDFMDITALNALLPEINSVPGMHNTYIWQANPNAQNYPLLVHELKNTLIKEKNMNIMIK